MHNSGTSETAAGPMGGRIEISVLGKWVEAPALRVNDQTIIVRGKWIKMAALHNEDWIEDELLDPTGCAAMLKKNSAQIRADILCFSQKVPETVPRYRFAMETRSIAVAEVARFKAWWEKLPQETRKNVRR